MIDGIAMPAKYRLGADQQPHLMQYVPGEPVQQRCQEDAVRRVEPEPDLRAAQCASMVVKGFRPTGSRRRWRGVAMLARRH
ncbi:hypothetical protein AB0M46_22975 [Dactylosporangium sp. NPDC051485]|uniref:hypothetical protein n=1 Tax=Dactylosporangium sp. NPDC051485 TaxID=3154846 RepID=UPI00341826FE